MAHPLAQLLTDRGITLTSVFIPFSRSRNAHEKHPSLNWKVTILRNGKEILTTDYMAGSGHCPAYKSSHREYEKRQFIAYECEHGRRGTILGSSRHVMSRGGSDSTILPDIASVMACLLMDASVIDYSRFEDWASEYGYDTDSIKVKDVYTQCLQTALALRNGLGDTLFRELQTAAQDY